MATEEVLRKTLKNADGKPFVKYKGLENNFVLEDFEIIFDEIQNDRMGHTSMRVRVPMKRAGFPEDTHSTESRAIALRDLIARRFWESARTHARSPIPKTGGGEVYMPRPGQEVLERACIQVTEYHVEARFTADLPSIGNKVSATAMELLIFGRIATIVSESMLYSSYKQSKLYNHLFTVENADYIRSQLDSRGLAAFIAEGSILPRREDDLAPMTDAVPFGCDPSLMVEFEVPNGEPVRGLGIPKGFTAVVGSGGSGRSTLVDALFAGVYDHIPGDGREYVISAADASFVIDERGRPVNTVDVSAFVEGGSKVQTPRSSSAMSQFASVSESIETGSSLVIVDEEYSHPTVIRRGFPGTSSRETPLSELGHSMGESGVSLIMVTGDESAVRSADLVLMIDDFRVVSADVECTPGKAVFVAPAKRYPVSKGMSFEKSRKEVSTSAVSVRTVEIGEQKVDVPMAGLFDMSQTRAVADAIVIAKELMDGSRSMLDVCTQAISQMKAEDSAQDSGTGMHHAYPRPMDVAAVLNRHPGLLVIRKD